MNELTCAEINAAIAELRGEWEIRTPDGTTPFRERESPRLMQFFESRPALKYRPVARDYCCDWAACGPCLEEMVICDPTFEDIPRRLMNTGWQNAPAGDPLTEAIARAYHAWMRDR